MRETASKTPAESATLRLSGPADLISAIPYLMGFHPTESVVLVGLNGQQVAVTARLDLDAGAQPVHDTLATLAASADSVVAVVYTEQPAPRWLTELPVLDAVLVTGEGWRSLLCDDPTCCPPQLRPLPDPASPIAAQAVLAGLGTVPNREQLEASLRPGPVTATAEQLAAALAPIARRDAAWIELDSHTGDSAALERRAAHYLDLARHCTQDTRAAACWFLYAWAQWRLGNGARANIALDHAERAEPGYHAAALLASVLHSGIRPSTIPNLTPAATDAA